MSKDPRLLLTDVASYLATNGVGTIGTDLFLQNAPETPKVTTVVFLTGGPSFPDNPTRYPSFSVHHRNTNVSSGLAKATQIHSLLGDRWNVLPTLKGRIATDQAPGAYFVDQNGMFIYGTAYRVITTDQR